ncbi:MAG: polysaccharide deacetylase family protein [Anaeromyxobacter sp.]
MPERADGSARWMVRRTFKVAVAGALTASGLHRAVGALRRWQAGGVRVLVVSYHRVTPDYQASAREGLASLLVSTATLRRQLEGLARTRELVSLSEARRILSERPGRRRRRDVVAVTFDDGYADVHGVALPILAALRIPATAYVVTGYVGTSHRLPHDRIFAALAELAARGIAPHQAGLPGPLQAALDACTGGPAATLDGLIARLPQAGLLALASGLEARVGLHERELPPGTRMMGWDDVRALAAAGVEVGGHTVTHAVLPHLAPARARREVEGCRDENRGAAGAGAAALRVPQRLPLAGAAPAGGLLRLRDGGDHRGHREPERRRSAGAGAQDALGEHHARSRRLQPGAGHLQPGGGLPRAGPGPSGARRVLRRAAARGPGVAAAQACAGAAARGAGDGPVRPRTRAPSPDGRSPGSADRSQVAGVRTLTGRDIVCFSNDWDGDPLSKTHVMRILARENRVLWVNSIGNRSPRATAADARRAWKKLRDVARGLTEPEPNLHVLAPLYLPAYGSEAARQANRTLLRLQVRRAMRRLGMRAPISWSFLPSAATVAGSLGESLVLYHVVDEFSAFSDASSHVAALERRLLRRADLVIASSEKLVADKRPYNPRTVLVRHGVDHAHFARALEPGLAPAAPLAGLPRPVIGFFGLVADWIDLELVRAVADAWPQGSVVLVGKVITGLGALEGARNVHLFGRRPYAELPAWCRGFDVALTPFRLNALALAANPLKAREYVAAGLPNVCTDLPELRRIPGCTVARDRAGFLAAVAEALRDPGPSRVRSALVAAEGWEARVEEIRAHVAAVEGGGVGAAARAAVPG